MIVIVITLWINEKDVLRKIQSLQFLQLKPELMMPLERKTGVNLFSRCGSALIEMQQ